MADPEATLNPVNQFLVEHIAIDGAEATQDESGTLHVAVPPVEKDASIFSLDRHETKRFYELCSAAGRVSINLQIEQIGEKVTCSYFGVSEVMYLPEDTAEINFMVDLGNVLANNTTVGTTNPNQSKST